MKIHHSLVTRNGNVHMPSRGQLAILQAGKILLFLRQEWNIIEAKWASQPVDLPRKKWKKPGASDCQTPRFPLDLSYQTAAASAFWITLHGLIQLNRRSALAFTADCWWMLENGFNFAGTCWIPRGFEKSFSDHGQWIRFHVKWSVHVAFAVWVKSTAFPRFPKP